MVHQLRAGRVLELPLPRVRRNRRIGVPEPVRVRDEVRDPPPEPRGRVGGAGPHADRDAPAVDRDGASLVADGERLLRFGPRVDAGDRARGAGGRPQRAVAVGQPISGAGELHAREGRRRVGQSRELPDRAVVLRPDPDEPASDRGAADLGAHPDRPGDLVRRGVDPTHDAGDGWTRPMPSRRRGPRRWRTARGSGARRDLSAALSAARATRRARPRPSPRRRKRRRRHPTLRAAGSCRPSRTSRRFAAASASRRP